jgi:hypothetical protein
LLIACFAILAGCSTPGEVSEKDAANFSKTPGGDDGRSQANNDR